MIVWAAILAVVLSFGLCFFGVPMTQRVAHRLNFLDIPQRHKAHARPTPLLGGCAITLAVVMPLALAAALVKLWAAYGVPEWLQCCPSLTVHIPGAAAKAPQAIGILLAVLGMHVLGLVDDRKALGPWIKLFVQLVLAAFVVVFCNVRVMTMAGPAASITLSILWITAITNSFNFLDNMDGLAAGVAAICAAALLAAAAAIGQVFVSAWLCLILGALLGFLPYNFAPAKSFMGDAGSLVVGFLLAVVSCLTTYVSPGSVGTHYEVLVPLLLMAVPIYDTVSVMTLRIRERRNPMVGDRRHFSHRLVRRGMSVRTAVLTIYLCTAGTAISATLLPHVDSVGAILVVGQTLSILLIIALLESGDSRS